MSQEPVFGRSVVLRFLKTLYIYIFLFEYIFLYDFKAFYAPTEPTNPTYWTT